MTQATPPSAGRLVLERDGDALWVRIANEARANALDEAILDDLASLLQGPRLDGARVVLLTGAGQRHFSSGLDLAARGPDELVEFIQRAERHLGRAARAIAECPVPVVCVLNGAAVGGALEIAIACDWRIAARGAQLAMPAARIGVVYAADGLRRFIAAMGPARARRMFLTGGPVDADAALALGLVDDVVEPEALIEVARAAADDVARASPIAVAGTRAIVREIADGAPVGHVEETASAWRARAFASDDLREGLAAARARRPPRFRGS